MSAPNCPDCGEPMQESVLPQLPPWCVTCQRSDIPSSEEALANAVGQSNANGTHAREEDIGGAELLDTIGDFIERFQVLPSPEVRDLLSLWVLHTHAFSAAWATPYLRITSAAPESGKTQLLEILATLVRRGWHAINPSVAVLYRKVDRDQPTLLLDEMDNFPMDERRDALAVLNAGYKRGATIDRCRDTGDLESFSAFCAKAYAGLDKHQLMDTLLSRSITIRLERRLPTEEIEMWIGQLTEHQADPIRDRCAAWADQHLGELLGHEPKLPAGIINRAAEVWWALLAIAEVVGGDWPQRATTAALALSTGGDDRDGRVDQVLLLADLAEAFDGRDTLTTAEALATLNGLDESPPARRGPGRPRAVEAVAAVRDPVAHREGGGKDGEGLPPGAVRERVRAPPFRSVTSVTSVTTRSRPRAGCDGCDGCDGPGGGRPVSGEILTADQLADRWHVEKGWIYAKVRSGELPKIPLPGKYVRFRLDTIEAFERGELESNRPAA
jgi:hypothetical protein